GTLLTTANVTSSRPVTLTTTGTIDKSGSTDTFSGVIGGAGGLTSIGAGALILSRTNPYAGATSVSAGTLLLNGDPAGATGAVSVACGATLGGSGTTGGNVSIATGGHLVGVHGQTFTMNSLVLASGSHTDVSLASPSTTGLFDIKGTGSGAGNLT